MRLFAPLRFIIIKKNSRLSKPNKWTRLQTRAINFPSPSRQEFRHQKPDDIDRKSFTSQPFKTVNTNPQWQKLQLGVLVPWWQKVLCVFVAKPHHNKKQKQVIVYFFEFIPLQIYTPRNQFWYIQVKIFFTFFSPNLPQ
ncbi:MAG: hypothetical protein IPP17_23455 [Bacteroidetes bacterium]|nr:hypothetical protein [Bacteroidota bacterium]